jgi:hypothetical protein
MHWQAPRSDSQGSDLVAEVRCRTFRDALYGCFGRRADSLFELCDAILTTGSVASPVHLSLTAVHRRGWGSLYAALRKGQMDEEMLRDLLVENPLTASRGGRGSFVYASSLWLSNSIE